MRRYEHHHPCQDCGQETPCDGPLEKNYDGWPDVICLIFDQPGGTNSNFICEDCQINRDREHAAQLKEEYERSLGPEPRE